MSRRRRHPLDSLVAVAALFALSCISGLIVRVSVQAANPPPVNLGAEGLGVTVLLDAYDAATDTWSTADPSAITVTDTGGGDYQLGGLPVATGRDRYRVSVRLASDPDRELARMVYGALPGGQVLWIPVVTLPRTPAVFVEGDSSGTIGVEISTGLPAAIADPGTTVTMDLVPDLGGAALISDAAASVARWWEDATTGTYGAELVYTLGAGDLPAGSAAGDYRAYFRLTFTDASTRVLPPRGVPVDVLREPGS